MTQGAGSSSRNSVTKGSDLATVFRSDNFDAEMEAMSVHSVLEANGIASTVVGPSVIPSMEFQVQVAQADLEAAQKTLAEAEAAGPNAADEAEAESEK